jgi:mono/diheme cytochrome c family protein
MQFSFALVLATAVATINVADAPDGQEPRPAASASSPGLVATFRDTDGSSRAEALRVEPDVSIFLKADESPHPRVAARAWSAAWRGQLQVLRAGPHKFSAQLAGKVRVRVGDREVLNAEARAGQGGPVVGPETELPAGEHAISVEFSKTDGPAGVRLFWESRTFRREPLPYHLLSHRRDQTPAQLARSQLHDRGRFLVEELSCVACHQPGEGDVAATRLAKRTGPDLSRIGERAYAGWILRWLASPQELRPQAVMPRMFSNDEAGAVERYAVASYLSSLGRSLRPQGKTPDANELRNMRRRGERLFGRVGCAVCHARTGEQEAVAELTGLGSKTAPDQLAQYLQNPLAIDPSGRMPHMGLDGGEARDLAFFLCESTRDDVDQDLPAPPSADLVVAAYALLPNADGDLAKFKSLDADRRLKALGERLVAAKGCANCHRIAPDGQRPPELLAAPAFATLRQPANHERGCLRPESAKAGSAAPHYALAAEHRDSIRAFLSEASDGAGSPAPGFAAETTLHRFNCVGCHARFGQHGLSAEMTEELKKFEEAQDAESIQPPPLTEVGAKLRTGWLRGVLVQGTRARPWMGLRMPQFGEPNVGHLPDALAAADGVEPSDAIREFAYDAESVEAGRQLVGKKGFGCIGCHDIAGRASSGTRGPDLATMRERVRYDWYKRWLDEPQRMQPGTRMPTVFPNGTSALKTLLAGSGDAQSDAIWQYLSLGANLPLPEGLDPPRGLVLAPHDRPIVIRTFMPETSAKSFAVGFPEGVAFAFDAGRCRLAYGWTGGFLNASPIWDNRGGSQAGVQGPRFWTSPGGFPWSFTNSQNPQPPDWLQIESDAALGASLPEGQLPESSSRLRFVGHTVSRDGRPAFRYSVNVAANSPQTAEIVEQFEPRQGTAGVGVLRRFSVRTPQGVAGWLLVGRSAAAPQVLDAQGNTIAWDSQPEHATQPADRHIVLASGPAGALVLSALAAPIGSQWSLDRRQNQWHISLRTPPAPTSDAQSLAVAIRSPYRNEAAMIRAVIQGR